MSSTPRRETTASTLDRLRADAEGIARTFATGREAIPALAMGSDAEGVVHVGLDARGDVVRLDLDPSWRKALEADGLPRAVTEAVRRAGEVRTGDWASAIAAGGGAARPIAATVDPGDTVGGIWLPPGWDTLGEDDLRAAILGALAVRPAPPAARAARPGAVRELEAATYGLLCSRARMLPTFLASPVHSCLDQVHDGVTQALQLTLVNEAVAAEALGTFTTGLQQSIAHGDRPGGLPEASQTWAVAAIELTSQLADARAPHRAGHGRGRRRAIS